MIHPEALWQLKSGSRRRKLALCFGALERDIAGIAEQGYEYAFSSFSRADYTKKLIRIIIDDPKLPKQAVVELEELLGAEFFDERRACNVARNHLLAIIGSFPSEWDMIIAPHAVQNTRQFYSNVFVYAEDIRSPFNLGSIFRTAEAFGAEKLILSPNCPDPNHPRCKRSAMGCVDYVPWERIDIEDFLKRNPSIPLFVLETGAISIYDFKFPQKGIVAIGSEELGISPRLLQLAGKHAQVSIPMKGIKASINVGVALGVLMNEWTRAFLFDTHC